MTLGKFQLLLPNVTTIQEVFSSSDPPGHPIISSSTVLACLCDVFASVDEGEGRVGGEGGGGGASC